MSDGAQSSDVASQSMLGTLMPDAEHSNVAVLRRTEQAAAAHVAHPLNDACDLHAERTATDAGSSKRERYDMNTATGFTVTDRNGEFLAWSACVLVALKWHRENPQADRVTRCSDDAVMCYRRSRKRRTHYEEASPVEQVAA